MRITFWSYCLLISVLHAPTACAQKFIDLGSVAVNGVEWPPDHEAHSIVVDSVILCFRPDAAIGSLAVGIGNRPTYAFIKGDMRKAMKDVLDRLRTADNGRHVVLKVDTLEISERLYSTREIAWCRFAGEVIERTDSGWCSLYAYGTTLSRAGGLDATDDHAANIAHALDNCLRRAAKAIGSADLQRRFISDRNLHRPRPRLSSDLRAIDAGRPSRGVYFSFMDLVDGTPDTSAVPELKESANSTEITRVVKPKGASWDLKAFAISDGERLYVNTGKEYNEVTIGPNGLFTYWTPTRGESQDAASMMAVGFLFGALGVALASSGGSDGAPVRLDIDLITGHLSRTHRPTTGRRETEHWFHFTKRSPMDTTVCLYLYGGDEGCLRKGQHHVVRLVPRPAAVPIELRVGGITLGVELDTNSASDQVYLIQVKQDGTPSVDKVNPMMASDIIERLEPSDEVK